MLSLQPNEQVIFPAPFVPTEFHPLVVTNKRVIQYAPLGPYPIAEFELSQVDFIGRLSERPYIGVSVLIAAVGLILLIVAGWKLLPPILHAGVKTDGGAEMTEDGRVIQGKDDQDDYPFFDKDIQSKSKEISAERLKQLSQIKPGIPAFTSDVKMGLLYLILGIPPLLLGVMLYRREQHYIFCRTKDANVHRLEVRTDMEQNMVLSSLQAAHQAAQR